MISFYFQFENNRFTFHPSTSGNDKVFAYLIHPFLHSPIAFPLSLCCELIIRLTRGQVTSPPSVLLCSFWSFWFFLHLRPLSSSLLSLFSTVLPFLLSCIPSCHKTLSGLPGYYHGNPQPLPDPLGEPVRSPVVHLRGEETVKCYLSSDDWSAGEILRQLWYQVHIIYKEVSGCLTWWHKISIHFLLLILLGWGVAGAWSLSQHLLRTYWSSRQFIPGLSYRDKQPYTFILTPTGNLEWAINLPPVCMFFGLWEEPGARENPHRHRENMQTPHRKALTWEFSPEPSCCEEKALTIVQLQHKIFSIFQLSPYTDSLRLSTCHQWKISFFLFVVWNHLFFKQTEYHTIIQ